MSELDDDRLAERLGRIAGPVPDVEAALGGIRPRARRARRRQLVARVGAAAVVVGMGGVVMAGLARDGGDATLPAGTSVSPPATSTPITTAPAPPTSTMPATPSSTSIPDSTDPPAPVTSQGGASVTVPEATSAPAPTSTASDAPPEERTITSPGGSITVRLADGRLTLVSQQEADGYWARIEDTSADRIRVRFESRDRSYRITATIDGGRIASEVSESGSSGDGESGGFGDGGHRGPGG